MHTLSRRRYAAGVIPSSTTLGCAVLGVALALCCGGAQALTMGGKMRVHAVIGQPLAVVVPLSFSGPAPGAVEVQVEPEPGLAEAEEAVAETVRASYDAGASVIRLTTPRRVVVPAVRLRLTVSSGPFQVEQGFDVLVDLPDFNRQYDRAGDSGGDAGVLQEIHSAAIRLVTIPGEHPSPSFGDAATQDGTQVAAQRPRATPQPPRHAATPARVGQALQARVEQPRATPRQERAHPARPSVASLAAALPMTDPLENPPPADAPAPFSLGQARTEAPRDDGRAVDAFLRGMLLAAGASVAVLALGWTLWQLRRVRLPRLPAVAGLVRRGQPAEPMDDAVAPDPALLEEIIRLRSLLADKPWRSDVRYQLAQRLYKAGDAAGFAEVAPELKSSLSVGVWQRVRLMGRELLRDDPRFA